MHSDEFYGRDLKSAISQATSTPRRHANLVARNAGCPQCQHKMDDAEKQRLCQRAQNRYNQYMRALVVLDNRLQRAQDMLRALARQKANDVDGVTGIAIATFAAGVATLSSARRVLSSLAGRGKASIADIANLAPVTAGIIGIADSIRADSDASREIDRAILELEGVAYSIDSVRHKLEELVEAAENVGCEIG